MRPPRESLLLLGLMTSVCLFAGLVFGIWSGLFVAPPRATATVSPLPPATLAASPDITVSVTPGPQKALLLMGVTDATVPATNLEACWVITYRSGVPEYYVVAFPPSAMFSLPGLDGPRTLRDIHGEDLRLQLDHNFVRDAVQTRFTGLTIEYDVTLDRSDLANLVGHLGGLSMNSQVLSGPALLQTYDAWPVANDVERLDVQGDILRRLFALLAEREWTAANLVTFVTQIPRVSSDSATVSELHDFAQGAPPLVADGLVWHPYGPEMEAASMPAAAGP